MSGEKIHFEVFARRTAGASMTLEMACEDRSRAIEFAEELMDRGRAVAVRVNKESLDSATGEFNSVAILNKGAADTRRSKAPVEDAGPACVSPSDLYSVHARHKIGRLFETWLARQRVTAFELLHRPDLVEKLEASGVEVQHAVQKIAIPEAQAKRVSTHEVIRAFNALAERAMNRVIKDGRQGMIADLGTEPFAAFVARLVEEPDAAYRIGGAVAARLADAGSWAEKVDRILDLADAAPRAPRERVLAFQVLKQPLSEILGARAGMAEILGPDLDGGLHLVAMTRLAAAPSVDMVARLDPGFARLAPVLTGPAARLAVYLDGGEFDSVRAAVARRVIGELRSSRRLRPQDALGEIDVLRALAMALTAAAGKLLPLEDIREAFIERSRILVGAEFVTAVIGADRHPFEEVRNLLKLAENVTGSANKRQAGQWLIGTVSAARFDIAARSGPEAPVARLQTLADLQKAAIRVGLTEADQAALCHRLGDLGGHVEAEARLAAQLARAAAPVGQKLGLLLRLATGESAPLGPAADRAKAEALKLVKSPEVRRELAEAPGGLEKVRPLLQALGAAA